MLMWAHNNKKTLASNIAIVSATEWVRRASANKPANKLICVAARTRLHSTKCNSQTLLRALTISRYTLLHVVRAIAKACSVAELTASLLQRRKLATDIRWAIICEICGPLLYLFGYVGNSSPTVFLHARVQQALDNIVDLLLCNKRDKPCQHHHLPVLS